jgi:uncharacterized repeat protein (TIGR01451 family)
MMGARAVRLALAVVVLAGLASCNPNFPEGSELTAVPDGGGVRIAWDAVSVDEGRTVESYRIDVDGVEVRRTDASMSSCVLSGLAAGVDHDVVVTAYDSEGAWSNDSGFTKSLTATVTGPAGSAASEIRCDGTVSVEVSQPSPGAGTKVIGGQVAPVTYEWTVTNGHDAASEEVTVSNPVPAGTTLVAGSPTCGDANACSVEVVAGAVEWTLSELPAASSVSVSFAVTVNPELGSLTTVTNQAGFTVAGSPVCGDQPCATNSVLNPAEPWKWIDAKPVAISPRNSIFYAGRNTFEPVLRPSADVGTLTNDPAATVDLQWSCSPSDLCLIEHTRGKNTMFNLVWDDVENQVWVMYLSATARQGDRTLFSYDTMWFNLDEGSQFWWASCRDAFQGPYGGSLEGGVLRLSDAWAEGRENCAATVMTEDALRELFDTPRAPGYHRYMGCDPVEIPDPAMDCFFEYGGGSLHFVLNKNAADRWQVVEVYRVSL